MSSEDRKYFSEVIKNLVIAFSIIVGGLWAWYTFDARLEIQNARAKLEKLENELTQRPVLIPSMEIFVSEFEATKKWLLKIRVNIKNNGNSDAILGLSQETIKVAKAKIENGIISGYQSQIYTGRKSIPSKDESGPFKMTTAITLLSGQNKEMVFIVEVDDPGLYQVDFESKPGKTVSEIREKVRERYKGEQNLRVNDFILIGLNSDKGFQPGVKRDGLTIR